MLCWKSKKTVELFYERQPRPLNKYIAIEYILSQHAPDAYWYLNVRASEQLETYIVSA